MKGGSGGALQQIILGCDIPDGQTTWSQHKGTSVSGSSKGHDVDQSKNVASWYVGSSAQPTAHVSRSAGAQNERLTGWKCPLPQAVPGVTLRVVLGQMSISRFFQERRQCPLATIVAEHT